MSTSKTKKKKKKARSTKRRHKTPGSKFGLGLSLGSESTFGNGLSAHWQPISWLEFESAVGYNTSGLKAGLASTILLNVNRSFQLAGGFGLAYSLGNNGSVTLDDAEFFPEGSNQSETLRATKEYTVSPALLGGIRLGAYYWYTKSMGFRGFGNYNMVLSGNEVTFAEDISYDKDVEITNEGQFDEEFQQRAEDKVKAGGLGFSVGVIFLF